MYLFVIQLEKLLRLTLYYCKLAKEAPQQNFSQAVSCIVDQWKIRLSFNFQALPAIFSDTLSVFAIVGQYKSTRISDTALGISYERKKRKWKLVKYCWLLTSVWSVYILLLWNVVVGWKTCVCLYCNILESIEIRAGATLKLYFQFSQLV